MRLSQKIALLLLTLGLFPLLVMGSHTLTQVEDSLSRTTEQSLLALGEQVGKEVGRIITEGNNALLLLAQNPLLAHEDTTKAQLEQIVHATKRFHPIIKDMTLLDAEGQVRASTSYSFRGSWKDTDWFKTAIKGRRLFSGVHALLYPPQVVMTTSAPVVDQQTGKIFGVLVGHLSLVPVQKVIADMDFAPNGHAILVDENGQIVACPDPETLLDTAPCPATLSALDTRSSGVSFVDGGKTLVAYQPLPQSEDTLPLNWSIMLLQPSKTAYSAVHKLRTSLVIAVIIALAGIAILSTTVSRRLGSRFSVLTEATRRIGDGDFDINLKDTVNDEIGEMTTALNDTAAQLARSRQIIDTYQLNLEDMVDRRTLQLKRAKDDADRANRAKDDFLATMSHEIRTPLSTVIGLAEELQFSELTKEQHTNLQVILDASDHLLQIVNDILDTSKIEAGELVLSNVNFELDKLLSDLMRGFDFQARGKGLGLSLLLSAEVPLSLHGDPTRLRQILYNLLGNALKFTRMGEITLEVEPAGGSPEKPVVTFTVTDTGIGIPEDKIDEIFKRYRQANGQAVSQFGGTGLGLAICQHLAELMGGHIEVRSALNRGSSFSFTVAFKKARHSETTSSLRRELPRQPRSLRVLVADDNRVNQLLARRHLERLKHHPTVVSNGREALRRLSQDPFDVVLMDVEMPEMDGPEVIHQLRTGEAGERNRKIPVLALTAHARGNVQQRCHKAGMNGYLEKPLGIVRLGQALADATQPSTDLPRQADAAPAPPVRPFDPTRAMTEMGMNDEEFRHLAAIGMEEMDEQTALARKAVQIGDMRQLARCAHMLKGTSKGIGADECHVHAVLLEESARRLKTVSATDHLRHLSHALDKIRSSLAENGFLP